jgi:ribosome-associated protein
LIDPVTNRVHAAVHAALDKKAFDLDVLDVRNLTSIADYFLICSGNTERQTLAIADSVQQKLAQLDKTKARLIEGMSPGRWILLDFGDFVMHIFTDECRRFYGLERLWGDAPDVSEEFKAAKPPEVGEPIEKSDRRAAPRPAAKEAKSDRRTTVRAKATASGTKSGSKTAAAPRTSSKKSAPKK